MTKYRFWVRARLTQADKGRVRLVRATKNENKKGHGASQFWGVVVGHRVVVQPPGGRQLVLVRGVAQPELAVQHCGQVPLAKRWQHRHHALSHVLRPLRHPVRRVVEGRERVLLTLA